VSERHLNLQSAISKSARPTPYPHLAGLYLHIPFCLSKCPYCGFYSIVQPGSVDEFINALLEEIRLLATHNPSLPTDETDRVVSRTFDTVYFGGGTPSLLPYGHLENILKQINKSFNLTNETEITFEANPGDCNLEYSKKLHSLGINRLNLGVQSFDENILRFLGRRHTAIQARTAVGNARKAGFKNLGLDFIYGIPEQKIGPWLDTLKIALTFSPEHLSCYQLTIEEHTPFASEVEKETFSLPEEEAQREFFIRTSEFLEDAGYVHYEVSNFARNEKYFSHHNQKYWDHTPYLGLGPGAHSFDGSKRWWNSRSVKDYISNLSQGRLPIQDQETLNNEQRMFEDIFLGLRTRKGVHLQTILKKYSRDLLKEKGKLLSAWEKEGLVEIRNGFLCPTRAGLAVADRLALI